MNPVATSAFTPLAIHPRPARDASLSSPAHAHIEGDRIHPRPQLARAGWIDLDGPWDVVFGDEGSKLRAGGLAQTRSIQVPFPPESELSGIGEDGHTTIWYRREWAVPRPVDGRRVLLHFEGVDHIADVWVNGEHVVRHEGGQVGFHADVTDTLAESGLQTIIVRATDSPSLEQPRGKQDWESEPHVIWYRRTSGIWRQVWSETVDPTHVASLIWMAGDVPGSMTFEARVAGRADVRNIELELRIDIPGGRPTHVSTTVVDGRVSGTVRLLDPRFDAEPGRLLWSPEKPTLLEVDITVRADGTIVDQAHSYIGLRTVGTDDRAFLLNGRPYFLRLVLEQAFWQESHLASPSDEALRREVELIKELGFNGIRMHQVTADPRFLYWCDRLGLLVWADAAAAYHYSDVALARTTSEWTEIVRRDRNHPSVVAWVAFNESWGVPDLAHSATQRHAVTALYHLIKAIDPTRPVIGNDGWEYVVGDMLGIHDYTQDSSALSVRYGTHEATNQTTRSGRPGGRSLRVGHPNGADAVPVVLSEFGGATLSYADSWEGYGSVGDEQALVDRIAELVGTLTADGLAGFCYTQLTDTLQEANGLLTESRTPKADVAALQRIFSGAGHVS